MCLPLSAVTINYHVALWWLSVLSDVHKRTTASQGTIAHDADCVYAAIDLGELGYFMSASRAGVTDGKKRFVEVFSGMQARRRFLLRILAQMDAY